MVNLHDLYLSTIETVLEANRLSVANQPAGDKPAGVLWAMPSGTTKPDVIIAYEFMPQLASFNVVSRDYGRSFKHDASYVGGIEGFLQELVKFINAGRLAAPKGEVMINHYAHHDHERYVAPLYLEPVEITEELRADPALDAAAEAAEEQA